MGFPKVGDRAPSFTLINHLGESVSLEDFKNKKNLVLYFYPKASTPGCTTQACGLRDANQELAESDTVIIGISPDNPQKLKKFIDKYDLNFTLLADEDHAVAEKYGVWGLKKFMGREYMGIMRTSFIIDKSGCIRHVLDKINTKTHDQDVLAYVGESF